MDIFVRHPSPWINNKYHVPLASRAMHNGDQLNERALRHIHDA